MVFTVTNASERYQAYVHMVTEISLFNERSVVDHT